MNIGPSLDVDSNYVVELDPRSIVTRLLRIGIIETLRGGACITAVIGRQIAGITCSYPPRLLHSARLRIKNGGMYNGI
jgi:hypothetical protein